ncbi:MAG: NUDIX hydrolase [Candidatus Magasanikbacteria bacterium]|jgi:8-oxo-dGTP pyrophosphatase MutT (NUDIX family)
MIKTLSKKLIYKNHWITVWEDKVDFGKNNKGMYSYMERNDAGPIMIALTKDNKVALLKEWRYPIKKYSLGFPVGGREKNESWSSAAKRELKEETGISARKWTNLGKIYIDPGVSTQYSYVYLAEDLIFGVQELEHSENLTVKFVSLVELEKLILKSAIKSNWLLASYAKLSVYLNSR